MIKFKQIGSISVVIIMAILFIESGICLAEEKENKGYCEHFSLVSKSTKKAIAQFSLTLKPINSYSFFLESPYTIKMLKRNKNWLRPTIEILGINAGLWAYDWYIKKYTWASISIRSIGRNIKKGYTWDNSGFQCNQLEHPYNGSAYFSAGRAAGLNFQESALLTLFGNSMWEIALENEPPSINDGIFTTCGGVALGEIWFRLANLIIDENSKGIERGIRETMVLFVNPVLAFDRLVTGKSFRRSVSQKHNYIFRFPLGISGHHFITGADIEYADAATKENLTIEPYDYFRFHFQAKPTNKGIKNEEVLSSGLLWGRRLEMRQNRSVLAGIFLNFDYISKYTNKLSAIGAGPGLVATFNLGSGLSLNTFSNLSGMFSCLSSSVVQKYGEGVFSQYGENHFGADPYYLGPGLLGNLDLELGMKNAGSFRVALSHYEMLYSVQTNATKERATRLSLQLAFDIIRGSQVGVEYKAYFRSGTYRNYFARNCSQVFSLFYVINF